MFPPPHRGIDPIPLPPGMPHYAHVTLTTGWDISQETVMPIDTAGSSFTTAAQAVPQRKPAEIQAQKPRESGSTEAAARAAVAGHAAAQEPVQPKPVANAEGQKIGQLISVTA